MLLTSTPQEVSVARRFAVTAIARLGGDEEAQDRVRTLVSERGRGQNPWCAATGSEARGIYLQPPSCCRTQVV